MRNEMKRRVLYNVYVKSGDLYALYQEKSMNKVLREEKKFLISQTEFFKISHDLENILHLDPHSGALGYTVRSLYFDTIHDGDYFEKSDGVELRKKIRLRIYHPTDDYAMLEMKQKQGSMQLKRSLRVERADAILMTKGDYSPLLKYENDFASECYALMHMKGYRPKTIVEYKRKAFIAKENRIRITFDHEINATESCFDLFGENLIMNPVMDRQRVILEVKYNNFLLEYIKRVLNQASKSELSVSKYVLARQTGYLTRL